MSESKATIYKNLSSAMLFRRTVVIHTSARLVVQANVATRDAYPKTSSCSRLV